MFSAVIFASKFPNLSKPREQIENARWKEQLSSDSILFVPRPFLSYFRFPLYLSLSVFFSRFLEPRGSACSTLKAPRVVGRSKVGGSRLVPGSLLTYFVPLTAESQASSFLPVTGSAGVASNMNHITETHKHQPCLTPSPVLDWPGGIEWLSGRMIYNRCHRCPLDIRRTHGPRRAASRRSHKDNTRIPNGKHPPACIKIRLRSGERKPREYCSPRYSAL